MNSFAFWSPTKVVFGADTAGQTGSEVKFFGGTNVLILYGGGSVVKSGLLDTVTKSLEDEGINYHCVGGVQPNPLLQFALKVIEDYKDKDINFVLAVGGGSSIDTAKAVAVGLAGNDVPLWDYHCRKALPTAALPVGVVLTIAAAGSETSDSAVLTNTEDGTKRGFNTPFNRPKFAIMDPILTYTLPSYQLACGIVDMLMHSLDRYFAPDTDNEVTDELSEGLMRAVIKYGRMAMENPQDYKARSEIMWAGSLTHNGITGLGQALDFSVHQFGSPLSARYDTAHGASLAATWPAWARYVYRNNIARFAQYARKVWGITESDDEAAALAGIAATEEYFRSIGMPVTITDAVGDRVKDDIDILSDICSYNNTRTIGSFKVLGYDDIKAIYQAAL
ncbi:MAG: iron-containing alcohol dehydrogenase [Oscillospiraceae bacterium]|nr:iron-containing alcohol dehydrogenase [Oscillospiraceae bacterium]